MIKFEYHGAYYIVYLVVNWCNSHLTASTYHYHLMPYALDALLLPLAT